MRFEMVKNVNPKFSTVIHSMAEFIINKEMIKLTKKKDGKETQVAVHNS